MMQYLIPDLLIFIISYLNLVKLTFVTRAIINLMLTLSVKIVRKGDYHAANVHRTVA